MITTEGKLHIKRYMARIVPSIGLAVAFGVGTQAENLSDTRLQFEIERTDVDTTTYDFTNDHLVFKCSLPEDFDATIYEVALFSMASNTTAGAYGSKLLSSFDSATEEWLTNGVAPVFTTGNARVGEDSLNHTPTTGNTSTSALTNLIMDFSAYSAADLFNIAFYNTNTNASVVGFRLKTDATNYYTFNISNPAVGYNFYTIPKGNAIVTGSPQWGAITSIEAFTTAAGGSANVDFEGLRIEDVDTVNPDYVLVARKVITPFVKQNGMAQDFEFHMDVNV